MMTSSTWMKKMEELGLAKEEHSKMKLGRSSTCWPIDTRTLIVNHAFVQRWSIGRHLEEHFNANSQSSETWSRLTTSTTVELPNKTMVMTRPSSSYETDTQGCCSPIHLLERTPMRWSELWSNSWVDERSVKRTRMTHPSLTRPWKLWRFPWIHHWPERPSTTPLQRGPINSCW